jgi:hypothetical protein
MSTHVIHTSYSKAVFAGGEDVVVRVAAPTNQKVQCRVRVHNTGTNQCTIRLLRGNTATGTNTSLTFIPLDSQSTETIQTTAISNTNTAAVTAPTGSPVELDIAHIPGSSNKEFRPLILNGGTNLTVTCNCATSTTPLIVVDVDE